jgi:uncharacterized protein (TIGR01777 family)
MEIAITGATGFIGRRLADALRSEGHGLRLLSRRADPPFSWDPAAMQPREEALRGCDAVVHLAGEPVAQRWTDDVKHRIRDSRVEGTLHLVQTLSVMKSRPRVLVCASAIGIYGDRGDEVLTESSALGHGFLPKVCQEWEAQADLAEALGVRVVKVRTGIVLGRGGGALAKMLPPFKAFAGGKVGGGRQWMSWVHLDDLVGLFRHAIDQPLRGVVNGTAPNPVTNAEFTRELASVLHRPALFPVPAFAIRALYGEMSQIVLGSQRVLPKAAEAARFPFRFPSVGPALRDLLAE